MTVSGNRWPRRVYSQGSEPDVRFSLANERTYLAWLRTALALMAAGLALEAFDVPDHPTTRLVLVVVLALLGSVTAIASFVRWAVAERALRLKQPLPPPRLAALLSVVLALACIAVLLTVLIE